MRIFPNWWRRPRFTEARRGPFYSARVTDWTISIPCCEGALELYSEDDERSSTIAIVPAVNTLVLSSILKDQTPLSARILEPTELLAVPVKLFVALLGRDPGFAYAVMQELASECQEIIEDFKSHRLRSTTERVANWMLRYDRKSGSTGRFVIPFDKRVLASYLGMAPEHLSRSFSALASAGVVVDGRRITLTDRAALLAAAGLGEDETQLKAKTMA